MMDLKMKGFIVSSQKSPVMLDVSNWNRSCLFWMKEIDNPFENITDSDVEAAVDDLNIVDASDDEHDIDIEIWEYLL